MCFVGVFVQYGGEIIVLLRPLCFVAACFAGASKEQKRNGFIFIASDTWATTDFGQCELEEDFIGGSGGHVDSYAISFAFTRCIL